MKNKTDQSPSSILNSYGDLTYNVGPFGVFQTNIRLIRMFFSGPTEEIEQFKKVEESYRELSGKVNRSESLTDDDHVKLEELDEFNKVRRKENQRQNSI